VLLIEVAHAIFQNLSITETILIIFVDEFLLIFLPALRGKLLRLEESSELTSLMRLGKSTLREESTLNLAVRKLFVSIDCYLMYLDFFFLVNNNIQDYLSLVGNIIALVNLDISVLEALIIEILLGKNLGTVEHIRSYLSALYHTQLLLHIFTLALLQTNIVDIRDTWTNRKIDMEIKLLTYNRVGSDSHLREKSMFPVALYGIGNLVARHSNLVAHTEA